MTGQNGYAEQLRFPFQTLYSMPPKARVCHFDERSEEKSAPCREDFSLRSKGHAAPETTGFEFGLAAPQILGVLR